MAEKEIVVLSPSALDRLLANLAEDHLLAAPVRWRGNVAFEEVRPGDDLAFDYATTLVPPRRLFVPPRQTIFRFRRTADGFAFERPTTDRPLALIGVHGCDLTGLRVMAVFHEASAGEKDVLRQLESAFVIGWACWVPCYAEAFCRDMGSLENEVPADVYVWDLGSVRLAHVNTAKGRNALAQLGPLPTAEPDQLVALRRRLRVRLDAFPTHFKFQPTRLPAALEASEGDLIWEANADRCLSCGRCNIVCPTCVCFDVQDTATIDGAEGERTRIWTGCQLPGFARVAGGHDFRPTRAQQLRYRVFRKAKYMPEKYGLVGCTGCGRCIHHCPVDISIREIFRQVGGTA